MTLTVNQTIAKLKELVKDQPGKGELPLYIYVPEIGDPLEIELIDGDISDRVDINTKEQ